MTVLPVLPAALLAACATVVFLLRVLTLYRVLTRTAPGHYRAVVLRWAGLTVSLLLLVLAAYRPGFPVDVDRPAPTSATYASDVNVFLVVDRSVTSRVADYGDQQARMVGIRDDIIALLEEYRGARFGMIGFATKAKVDWPLSQDNWSFRAYANQLAAYSLVPYDALEFVDPTAARDTLISQLEEAKTLYPNSKNVVFYFGDGAVGSQVRPEPFRVPADLIAGGAVLGYGSTAGGAVPASIADGRKLYYAQPGTSTLLTSTLDEAQLRRIAGDLDMAYYHRQAGQEITPVLPPVRANPMSDTAVGGITAERIELYWVVALLAGGLLLIEVVLTVREYRRNLLSRRDFTRGEAGSQ
jgi:Ca-activated chloride channel homolog